MPLQLNEIAQIQNNERITKISLKKFQSTIHVFLLKIIIHKGV